jgi:hypothetical protein
MERSIQAAAAAVVLGKVFPLVVVPVVPAS